MKRLTRKEASADPTGAARLVAYSKREGDCLIWKAGRNRKGYGLLSVGGSARLAHRVAWENHNGVKIPDGMVIDHLCRTPSCVEPSHLEVVTPGENTLRGMSPAAQYARRTHCKNGHEFTPENTYDGWANARICRTCRREYEREWNRSRTFDCDVCGRTFKSNAGRWYHRRLVHDSAEVTA